MIDADEEAFEAWNAAHVAALEELDDEDMRGDEGDDMRAEQAVRH